VIFSTHIMQEVKAICDRVLIINQGKIVADDTIEKLQRRITAEAVVTAEFSGTISAEALRKLPKIKELRELGPNRFLLIADAKTDLRPAIFDFAVEKGVKLLEIKKEVYDMDEVFQRLTKVEGGSSKLKV
jgi:ABC-2 type transport system ATP-binding protein